MNQKKIWGVLALFLSLFICLSCSDSDKDDPISLPDIENNTMYFILPTDATYSKTIQGGDGNYSVASANEQVMQVKLSNGKNIVFEALTTGETTVTIRDKSNNSYVLNVKVSYSEQNFIVTKCEVVITGDKLTVEEKKEIEEKALASIPVKVEGGYKFIYNNMELPKGDVYIYPEKMDGKSEKGSFERFREEDEENNTYYLRYKITTDKGTYDFVFVPYYGPDRSSDIHVKFQFIEDLTEIYKADYENIEKVYSVQRLTYLPQ